MTFRNIAEVKQANEAIGHHWFSPGATRFFNSRVSGKLVNGRYFVSSEKFDLNSPREYTIREALADGQIETVGQFGGYKTFREALNVIKTLS